MRHDRLAVLGYSALLSLDIEQGKRLANGVLERARTTRANGVSLRNKGVLPIFCPTPVGGAVKQLTPLSNTAI